MLPEHRISKSHPGFSRRSSQPTACRGKPCLVAFSGHRDDVPSAQIADASGWNPKPFSQFCQRKRPDEIVECLVWEQMQHLPAYSVSVQSRTPAFNRGLMFWLEVGAY
ncbi:hypothetical protein, partial [Ochrobactrum sp. 3-3]|uniref:hypothetical protein n=1 Tax=Ochrobactrum sp. 3-3 TaxID=1830124 RepID=UPI00196573D6